MFDPASQALETLPSDSFARLLSSCLPVWETQPYMVKSSSRTHAFLSSSRRWNDLHSSTCSTNARRSWRISKPPSTCWTTSSKSMRRPSSLRTSLRNSTLTTKKLICYVSVTMNATGLSVCIKGLKMALMLST